MVRGEPVKLILKPVLKQRLDDKADSLGIDTTEYVKSLIIEDLKKEVILEKNTKVLNKRGG